MEPVPASSKTDPLLAKGETGHFSLNKIYGFSPFYSNGLPTAYKVKRYMERSNYKLQRNQKLLKVKKGNDSTEKKRRKGNYTYIL